MAKTFVSLRVETEQKTERIASLGERCGSLSINEVGSLGRERQLLIQLEETKSDLQQIRRERELGYARYFSRLIMRLHSEDKLERDNQMVRNENKKLFDKLQRAMSLLEGEAELHQSQETGQKAAFSSVVETLPMLASESVAAKFAEKENRPDPRQVELYNRKAQELTEQLAGYNCSSVNPVNSKNATAAGETKSPGQSKDFIKISPEYSFQSAERAMPPVRGMVSQDQSKENKRVISAIYSGSSQKRATGARREESSIRSTLQERLQSATISFSSPDGEAK